MTKKFKKMIFISTILGTGALVLGSTLLASCSKSVVENNLNSYAQDSNQQNDVDFGTDTQTHTPTINPNIVNSTNETKTPNLLENNLVEDKATSSSTNKNQSILNSITTNNKRLGYKLGWYSSYGDSLTVNLKSTSSSFKFTDDNDNNSWFEKLRIFKVDLPYTLKLKLGDQSKNKYFAEYDYGNINVEYIYNKNLDNIPIVADSYFDGANYGHYLYTNNNFRIVNRSSNEVTFQLTLPPAKTPQPKTLSKINISSNESNLIDGLNKNTIFHTSGYIFVWKWWNGNLQLNQNGSKSSINDQAEELAKQLSKKIKEYFKGLYDSNNVQDEESFIKQYQDIQTIFVNYNDGDGLTDPINHWDYKKEKDKDGKQKVYGQWIADTIFRETNKENHI